MVKQLFKKSAVGGTTATLIPSTKNWSESKPTHLNATQIVLTFSATPTEFWGTAGDGNEYEVTIQRKT